ncbi:hypothetical protein OIDMADRAFT_24038 [Oidiodendron maius Zn]|uniref:Uncharacterized protein n=1 Tax=Oidiodendron maius (strain Zn) TaxID=913774 RepID=A0A0C3HBM9_OIDMZ|nr:hypothetical protein OIDMADRAFT_24038 [Oidiodendron maius Zn]
MRAYLMIHFLTREGKSRGGGHEEGTRRERDPRKSGSPQSWSDQFHRGEALLVPFYSTASNRPRSASPSHPAVEKCIVEAPRNESQDRVPGTLLRSPTHPLFNGQVVRGTGKPLALNPHGSYGASEAPGAPTTETERTAKQKKGRG